MSWFDIDAQALKYSNVAMVESNISEVMYQFGLWSFSTLNIWVYCFAFVLWLLGLFVFYKVTKKIEIKFSSYSKVIVVLSLVVLAYGAFVIILLWNEPFISIPEKIREGTFGDSFGTLNALFSGLAFSGVLITLLLQRKDLSEARQQVMHQQIESQFYNMLTLQHSVVQGFDLKREGVVTMVGRDCFKTWVNFLRRNYINNVPSLDGKMNYAYSEMWAKYQGDLSLYFRSLYAVFRFASECDHGEKKRFGTVARSFLSDFELVILFYNCLSERGSRFIKYVDEFAIFNNLDWMMLLDKSDLILLDRTAYGNNEDILVIYDALIKSGVQRNK